MKNTNIGLLFLLYILPFWPLSSFAQVLTDSKYAALFDLELEHVQQDSIKFSMDSLKNSQLTVLVFLGPECTISQKYMSSIRALSERYPTDSVSVIGVFPFSQDETQTIKKFVKEYYLPFPVLLDREFQLTKMLNAKVTPEFFLLDNEGNLLYRGKFNNWYYAIGKYRKVITEHYLVDAINQYFRQVPIKTAETYPVGSLIEIPVRYQEEEKKE